MTDLSKLVVAFATIWIASCPICPADDLSLADIVAAWQKTQAEVMSGKFEFDLKQWSKKGSLTPPDSQAPVPAEDVTFSFECSFLFQGGNIRFEKYGPVWDPDTKQFAKQNKIYTWDSKKATALNHHGSGPYIFIHSENVEMSNSLLRPIQYAFRMNQSDWYVFNPDKYQLLESPAQHRGLRCRAIEQTRKAMAKIPIQPIFTVCPDRSFSVVRYEAKHLETGKRTIEFVIDHQFDKEHSIWVPHDWTITYFELDGPSKIETVSVRNFLINLDVANTEFEAQLPADTMVNDLRYIGKPEQDYILRENGEKRVITRREMFSGATRDELVATESGMAGLRVELGTGMWSSPTTYVWLIGLLAFVLAGGTFAFRSRSQQTFALRGRK